ncbi:predicted protein [Naegleria gruberi]|uniref:Acyl-coenzyme A thioesterase THEM4 n=1 Tax=Naegleria gruberi TaxID=5762 RepID=D2VG40_NAEGR|nr:uncharacterized protein NAEGRDRAFT_79845 [Naegleria gruberi]EFC44203.1 predicted protein [Naegleria gruberi]|eukprot:XP_002676947.1 predicted protein [Naegleria gruberi strain NEG-M]
MFGVKNPRLQEAQRMFSFKIDTKSEDQRDTMAMVNSLDPESSTVKDITIVKQMRDEPERYERLSWDYNFPKLIDTTIQRSLGRKGSAFAVYSIEKLMFWDKKEKKIVGVVAFANDCEGPPACVHGGCIATALDEAFGWCCIRNIGFSGVTLNLSVNYFKFIPLKKAIVGLEIETEKVEGKKVFMKGKLYDLSDPSVVHNTGTALFYKANEHMPTWEEAVQYFGPQSTLTKNQILSYFKVRIKKKAQEKKEEKDLDVQSQPHRTSKL